MDYIRKKFGIPPPQKYNDGYYYWLVLLLFVCLLFIYRSALYVRTYIHTPHSLRNILIMILNYCSMYDVQPAKSLEISMLFYSLN